MKAVFTLQILTLLTSLPSVAEARDFSQGERVLVQGRFQRKCSARVETVPSPGFYQLTFDRAGCGDRATYYQSTQLQGLTFVQEAKIGSDLLRAGDFVVLKGFCSHDCGGRVKEITRGGYVALEHDSLLCADTESLRKLSELKKVNFLSTAGGFSVGQRVSMPGIDESETCSGVIRRLTDSGLAAIDFEQLTCASGGSFYSLEALKEATPLVRRRQASGEAIFKRVMREISSEKKSKPASRKL